MRTRYGFGVERVEEVGMGFEELWAKKDAKESGSSSRQNELSRSRREGRTDGLLQGFIAA